MKQTTLEQLRSTQTAQAFWQTVEARPWAHPYDPQGQRRPFTELRRYLWDAVNGEFSKPRGVRARRRCAPEKVCASRNFAGPSYFALCLNPPMTSPSRS